MGEWHKIEPRPYSPCNGCNTGSCSVTLKTVNGEIYTKTDYCQETCVRYLNFLKEGYLAKVT